MSHYLRLYQVINKTFGLRIRPLGTFVMLQLRQAISATTLGLDNIFFRRYRKQPIDRPIFIIGNPRSGTTFLHRLLWAPAGWRRSNYGRCSSRRSRHASCSAASSRAWTGSRPARYHPSDVHDTSLRGIETDDVAWFFRTLDGPFAWAYFLAWQDNWNSELYRREFGIDGVTERDKERFFRYYEACWRRNLMYKRSSRILAKTSMLTFRLDEVLERYPDCKLVYIIRDPVEVIPSGMSLIASVLENGYDMWDRSSKEDQERWIENLYQASCDILRRFYEAQTDGSIPERNLCVVRYTDLLQNLEPTIARIVEFLEIDPSAEFLEEVRAQAERQRTYKSGHKHSPDKFGLSPERIRKDLAFVYDAYGLAGKPTDRPAPVAPR